MKQHRRNKDSFLVTRKNKLKMCFTAMHLSVHLQREICSSHSNEIERSAIILHRKCCTLRNKDTKAVAGMVSSNDTNMHRLGTEKCTFDITVYLWCTYKRVICERVFLKGYRPCESFCNFCYESPASDFITLLWLHVIHNYAFYN